MRTSRKPALMASPPIMDEWMQLLQHWNDTRTDFLQVCTHEQQVATSAWLIICGGQSAPGWGHRGAARRTEPRGRSAPGRRPQPRQDYSCSPAVAQLAEQAGAKRQSDSYPNPFRDVPDARLYKTGELTRYRTDATLEYLGRTDDQVKVPECVD